MTLISGKIQATTQQMSSYLHRVNPNAPEIEQIYIDMGIKYGIRGDIAFVQAIHETNFFRFTGTAKIEWYNPAGLGVTGAADVGCRFPNWATGIEAQFQHLFGYSKIEPLPYPCVDPRYKVLIDKELLGTAPNWEDLNGKWAYPGTTYAQNILAKYAELLKEPNKVNLVISFSQQYKNKCILGDTEHNHMYKIAQYLYNILRMDQRFNLYLPPEINTGDDLTNLKQGVALCNQFIKANGGQGYEIDLHSDAGGYAKGCSGLYYNEAGRVFLEPIVKELSDLTPTTDVGMKKRTDLYALKNSLATIGLIEISFHDNIDEARWIHKELMSIAVRLANGLYKTFKNII